MLGLLEGTEAAWLKEMIGCVINVNVPAGPLHAIKGLYLAHQVGITSSWQCLLGGVKRPLAARHKEVLEKSVERLCRIQRLECYSGPPLGGFKKLRVALRGLQRLS